MDELGGGLAVDGGFGVRHTRHGRDAAGQGGRRAGGDGFVFLAARLAQMDVHVDEAGADDHARGVDGAVGLVCRACRPTPRTRSSRIHRSVT